MNRFFLTIILLFSFWQVSFCQQELDTLSEKSKAEIILKIQKAIERKAFTLALNESDKALEKISSTSFTPFTASIYYYRSLIYKEVKQYENAVEAALQVLAIRTITKDSSRLAEAHLMVGTPFRLWGSPEKSIEYINKGLAFGTTSKFHYELVREKILAYESLKAYDSMSVLIDEASRIYTKEAHPYKYADLLHYAIEAHIFQKKLSKALEAATTYYNLSEEIVEQSQKASVAHTLSYIYRQLKQYEKGLEYANLSLNLSNDQDPQKTSYLLNRGLVQMELNTLKDALLTFKVAQQFAKSNSLSNEEGKALTFQAALLLRSREFTNALDLSNKALEIAKNTSNDLLESDAYFLISEIYSQTQEYKKAQNALKLYSEALNRHQEKENIKIQQNLLLRTEAEQKDHAYQMLNAERERQQLILEQIRLEGSQKEQALELLNQKHELQLAQIQNYKLEQERSEQRLLLESNRLLNEQRERQIDELKKDKKIKELLLSQSELQEKERQKTVELLKSQNVLLEKEQEVQQLLHEQDQKQFRNIMIGLGLLALLLLLVLIAFYKNRKKNILLEEQRSLLQENQKIILQKNADLQISEEKQRLNAEELLVINEQLHQTSQALESSNEDLKINIEQIELQKELIEVKNRDITSSITYAQRIQSAILPPIIRIQNLFPHSFVIYKPRDIVSGDFYWFHQTDAGDVFIAVADCTGHGVPGALLSLLCSNTLSEVVREDVRLSPDKILHKLDTHITTLLNQQNAIIQDGMDIALTVISSDRQFLYFSGANIPLYYIQKSELIEISGTKSSIGGSENQKHSSFTLHIVPLMEDNVPIPTQLFFATDGVRDQFGGPNGKKLMKKGLRNWLTLVNTLPPQEQEVKMQALFSDWIGEYDAVDDMLLLSIRL